MIATCEGGVRGWCGYDGDGERLIFGSTNPACVLLSKRMREEIRRCVMVCNVERRERKLVVCFWAIDYVCVCSGYRFLAEREK